MPVSEEHARKVLSYVELARSEGATVECGGERVSLSGTVFAHFYFIYQASRWKGSVLKSATLIVVLNISVVPYYITYRIGLVSVPTFLENLCVCHAQASHF